MLDYIITNLKDKFTIIYNRPRPQNITNDNSDIYDMDEYSWLEKEHPDVILMENLWKENKGNIFMFESIN